MANNLSREAVILIGHGGVAKDTPRFLVEELRQLEGQRRAEKLSAMTPREAELNKIIRQWPRTPESDPYKYGIEKIAEKLRARVQPRALVLAYNEFCAPSVDDAIETLVQNGTGRIFLMPTMFTPGGVHSEIEIPEIVAAARRKYPSTEFVYAWPFDMDRVAEFLAAHLAESAQPTTSQL